jgi:UDP-3-O-[3-hydroxymyristoyl] glucosamine N-acyltransferase
MKNFFQRPLAKGISATAYIGSNVTLGEDLYIGHHVVIEDDCVIGNRSRIDHNTVIRSKTVIGNDVVIGCNTSIGSDGFGYEKNEDSIQELIPHIGNVYIEDYVEIGDNVTIDKAVLGSTIIGSHSKVDNQTYIAHGVRIGKNCLLIGGSVVSGSAVISDDVWISPNATLINKVHVGEKAMIGIGAVVLKNVDSETVVAGNPARPINTNNISKEQL